MKKGKIHRFILNNSSDIIQRSQNNNVIIPNPRNIAEYNLLLTNSSEEIYKYQNKTDLPKKYYKKIK